jgi:hypothetical protein
MTWFDVYFFAAPLAFGWAALRSHLMADPGLFRCSLTVAGLFAAIQAWFAIHAGDPWAGQPWLFYLLSHAVATSIILREPAGQGNAVMGGVTLFGVTISGLHGARVLFYGYTPEADWSYWYLMFLTGWVALLVLVGWSHVDTGRRIAARLHGMVDTTLRQAHIGSVAR